MNSILSFDKNKNKMAVLSLDNTIAGDVRLLEPETLWAHNDKKMSKNGNNSNLPKSVISLPP
jgi:hypothetical protein